MRRLLVFAAIALVVASCTGRPYEPTFGFALETLYADGIPEYQQRILDDGRLTRQELDQATQASDACVAALPGIESVEPFRWVEQEGDFEGGEIEYATGADRDATLAEARLCYIEYVGLVEYAWLDQYYFGEWTEENLLD